MKLNSFIRNSIARVFATATLLLAILALFPDSLFFRYPNKQLDVRIMYNAVAIVLVSAWMIFAIRQVWCATTLRSVIVGLFGAYLVYFPSAILAEAVFRGTVDFVFGNASLISGEWGRLSILLIAPVLCGSFVYGGIIGLVANSGWNQSARTT